jgi:hypothetical protein
MKKLLGNTIIIFLIAGVIFCFGLMHKEIEDRFAMIEARQDQIIMMTNEIYPKETILAYMDKAPKSKKWKIK